MIIIIINLFMELLSFLSSICSLFHMFCLFCQNWDFVESLGWLGKLFVFSSANPVLFHSDGLNSGTPSVTYQSPTSPHQAGDAQSPYTWTEKQHFSRWCTTSSSTQCTSKQEFYSSLILIFQSIRKHIQLRYTQGFHFTNLYTSFKFQMRKGLQS